LRFSRLGWTNLIVIRIEEWSRIFETVTRSTPFRTIFDAAECLGVSKKRIYNLIASRQIPFSHPPGIGLRIDWKGLEALLEKGRVQPADPRMGYEVSDALKSDGILAKNCGKSG
jgi:excisionase family DNA binding protein